jgi:hypothetical protein
MSDIPDTDFVYDIETYYDLFCADITHVKTRTRWIFEVSDRRDQSRDFVAFIHWLRDIKARMFGFNNVGFDYPVIHSLCQNWSFTPYQAHKRGTDIIFAENRWENQVWASDRILTQGDLYLIHHFDNKSRSTSLKKLEINMRSATVVDLPYPPDQPTTSAQKTEIVNYMCHDVSETLKFYHATLDQITFRDQLAERYPDLGDVLNMNDTKIGKKFFEMQLEKAGTPCYARVNGRRQPLQTKRESIALRDVISPRVAFQEPDFIRIKTWLESQVLSRQMIEDTLAETVETKGVFKGVTATVNGFTYHFGTGGIHGSIESTVVREDEDWEIWDWDVASFYPNLGITNRVFPSHLSASFCDIYKDVYDMRQSYKKGTAENAMLKLALNGVYGDSNNKYSPFYDPQYTMSITINGQLMLCMLAEWLGAGAVRMIQANTDGITVMVHKKHVDWMKEVAKAWEARTGLELESVQYEAMFIRDVNSYIAVKKKDKSVKRIGAYAYETPLENPTTRELGWHKDHSNRVSIMAAEAQMVYGVSVEDFIMKHRDPFDFMLSIKVPRSSRLMHGEARVQNTSRYYVSTDGAHLTKFMPGLKGGPEREFAVQKGWTTTLANDARAFRWDNVNWLYYINEARKLVIDEPGSGMSGQRTVDARAG